MANVTAPTRQLPAVASGALYVGVDDLWLDELEVRVEPAGPSPARRVAAGFVAMAVVLGATVWFAHSLMAPAEEGLYPKDRPHLATFDSQLGGWLWYDGYWYNAIAAHGYTDAQVARLQNGQQSAAPFFPAYPIIVAGVGALVGDLAGAQILTTFLLGLVAALLFHRWARARLPGRAALVGTALLCVYPYAWYLYGTGYADALLLSATLAAFLALEADRPVLAGLAGLLATAARPTGVLVAVGLVAVLLDQRRVLVVTPRSRWWPGMQFHLARLRAKDAWVLLSVLGVAGFATFQRLRFGDALAFVHGERAWGVSPGVGTWLKLQLVSDITRHDVTWWGRVVAQGALAIGFIALAPAVARRFGWGYGVFALATAFVPSFSTADFMGSGRYLLACFPVFACLGAIMAERLPRPAVVLVPSALLLVWFTSLFARGYYLS